MLQAQAVCLLHRHRVIVAISVYWPARRGFCLPAHEGCATQRHEVDLAGPARADRGEEDLMKRQSHQTSVKV